MDSEGRICELPPPSRLHAQCRPTTHSFPVAAPPRCSAFHAPESAADFRHRPCHGRPLQSNLASCPSASPEPRSPPPPCCDPGGCRRRSHVLSENRPGPIPALPPPAC